MLQRTGSRRSAASGERRVDAITAAGAASTAVTAAGAAGAVAR